MKEKEHIIATVTIAADSPYGDYFKGGTGSLVGFVRGGEDTPCGVVIMNKKFVLVPLHSMILSDN